MALLDPILLRGVLGEGGDPPDVVQANLAALRADVVAEGVEAHLLKFLGDMTDRTGVVPPASLVEQHYQTLTAQGHPMGHAGTLLVASIRTAGLVCPSISDYRYALDQFRDRVVGDGLGVVLQQVGLILSVGYNYQPTKGPPQTLRGPWDAVRYAEQQISSLTGQFAGGGLEGSFRDVSSVYSRYQQRIGKSSTGVLSGWTAIDQVHDGLQPGDLALVLGYTSQMKSTMVLNWAYHAVVWFGKTVAFVPLESSIRSIQDSLVVLHCTHPKFNPGGGILSITYDRLRKGQLTPAEETIVRAAIDDLATCKDYGQFVYKDPDKANLTVDDLRRWAEQQDQTTPLDLLVVDYLGFVNPTTGGSSMKESAYANIAVRETKQLARNFRRGKGIPVLSPWQSNREGFREAEKNGGVYSLRALAWAPEAEKSADFVYYVYRDAEMTAAKTLQLGNIKARDRRQITQPFLVFADGDLRVIEDFDLTKPHQTPIPSLNQP